MGLSLGWKLKIYHLTGGIGIFLEKKIGRVQIPRIILPTGGGGADLPGGGVFFIGNIPPRGANFPWKYSLGGGGGGEISWET